MNNRSVALPLAAALALALAGSAPLAHAGDPIEDWYLDIYPKTTARAGADSQGNLAAGGLGHTEKYAPDGTLLWYREFSLAPQPHYTVLSWLAVDSQDNVIRGGYQEAYAGVHPGYLAVKYDPDGNLLWYAHLVELPGQAFRCELDEFDNIYLFGETAGPQWLTVKIDPSGQKVWDRLSYYGEPVDLEVRGGQVVGAGHVGGGVWAAVSYDYDGNVNWQNTYQNGSAYGDMGIGPDGQVALCGWGHDGTINSYGTVVQYDAQGNQEWVTLYNGPNGGIELFRRLAIDEAGAVIAVGSGLAPGIDGAWSILKLDSSGAVMWTQLHNNTSDFYEDAYSVSVGSGSSVYVGGLSDRNGSCGFGAVEGHVVKYDSDGLFQWHHHLECGGYPTQILFDPTGALYAVPFYELLRLRELIGEIYCASNANSTGSPAQISASGSAHSSAGNLTLYAAPVPNQAGVFFHGANQVQLPFGNGFLCASGGVERGAVRFVSGNAADYTYDNSDARHDLSAFVGTNRNFQFWYRDPAAGGAQFNTSNAVSIDVLP